MTISYFSFIRFTSSIRFRWALSLMVAITCFAGSAFGQESSEIAKGRAWIEKDFLHIEVGDYHVRFWKKAEWTICSANYKDRPLMIHTGAYQSVLKIRGKKGEKSTWIGSGHGGEKVSSVTLQVDGVSHVLESDLAVSGREFTVVKSSMLGPYQHLARVTVGHEGIVEDFDYEMQGEPVDIELMYAFMHCFTNETKQWVAGIGDVQEARGVFTDDNSFALKQDIRWAMVYAPSSEVGMVYVYPEVYKGTPPLKNALWNRKHDNKLYLAVLPSQEAGATFNYTVRMKAFAATESDWEVVGRQMLEGILASDQK